MAAPQDPAALNNQDLPSLFWDTMPEKPEEHPDYIAMQALAEESTPEERAENFKAGLCGPARVPPVYSRRAKHWSHLQGHADAAQQFILPHTS